MKYLFIYLVVINLFGYIIMYVDKKKAINGEIRIRESTLWGVALLGGALGTSLGMKKHRHKTRHKSFAIGFPLLAYIELAVVIYLIYLFNK